MSKRFRALQHRNFQLFIGGQLISLIGTWMQSTAQLWLVYKLTNSAALLGLFGFANQIAILVLASVGGYVGDRYNRHLGVIWTQTASMILAFLLAGLTLSGAIHDARGAWVVIVIGFLVGIVNAFDVPIRQAFLVQMVGREDLPNAIALNSSMFNGARVVVPAIAGFAIAWIHEGWCFFLNGMSFIAVILALLAMRIPKTEPRKPESSPVRDFGRFPVCNEGLADPLVLLLLEHPELVRIAVFGISAGFARYLHHDAKGFGLLMSAAGIGAVLGALQFAARTSYKGLARWIAAMSVICSACLTAFSQSTVFWVSAALLFVIGFAATSQMAATNTTVQNRVPDSLRSRVMAVYATMFMGVQPIGSLLAGGVARHSARQRRW